MQIPALIQLKIVGLLLEEKMKMSKNTHQKNL